jgi:hypothetical protein
MLRDLPHVYIDSFHYPILLMPFFSDLWLARIFIAFARCCAYESITLVTLFFGFGVSGCLSPSAERSPVREALLPLLFAKRPSTI